MSTNNWSQLFLWFYLFSMILFCLYLSGLQVNIAGIFNFANTIRINHML